MLLLLIITTTAFALAGRRPERPHFFFEFLGLRLHLIAFYFLSNLAPPYHHRVSLGREKTGTLAIRLHAKTFYFLSNVSLPYYHRHRVSLGREKAGTPAIFLRFLGVSVAPKNTLFVE